MAALAAVRRPDAVRDALRERLRARLGGGDVFFVSSGRAALTLILRVLRRQAGPERDEVVVPAYTCFSVPSAIVRAGLRVAPCDVDLRSLDFDESMLAQVVSRRTLCVVPNHLFGFAARLDGVCAAAASVGASVVEDAAQAFGATAGEKPIGTIGDAGFFSLGRGKPLTSVEGGVIVAREGTALAGAIGAEVAQLRRPPRVPAAVLAKAIGHALFLPPRRFDLACRLPFVRLGESIFSPDFAFGGLSPFQAGLALVLLSRQDSVTRTRRRNARALTEALGRAPSLQAPVVFPGSEPAYLRLPVIAPSAEAREHLYAALQAFQLGASRMYPTAITEIAALRPHLASGARLCPQARDLARRLLTLPTHPFVAPGDLDTMAHVLASGGALA